VIGQQNSTNVTPTPGPEHVSPRSPTAVRVTRLFRLIRENRAMAILLAIAAVVRVLVMIAYQPAFWYGGDSGSYIMAAEHPLTPMATVTLGYVVFLKVLRHTHTLFSVVAVQHVLGLLMAVAVYALLRRRGVRKWIATLAVVPILFEALEVLMEHTIMTETLFMTLVVATIVLLFWPRTPPVPACAAAGLSLVSAWFVRPVVLPFVVILFGYLVLRRAGWRRWVAFAIAFAIPYVMVQAWVSPATTPYGTEYVLYYGRVAGFAKCDQLVLTDAERKLCPPASMLGHRPDWYIWVEESPGFPYRQNAAADPILRQFVIDVVRQQPLDYLKAVGQDTAAHLVDGVPVNRELGCVDDQYAMPQTARLDGPGPESGCRAELASDNFQWPARDPNLNPPANPLTKALSWYSYHVWTPHLAKLAALLLVGVAVVMALRRRRRDRKTSDAPRDPASSGALAVDAGTLAILALILIVVPNVVLMYGTRYALPALPLLSLAAGMAAQSLLARRPTSVMQIARQRTAAAQAAAAQPQEADPQLSR
jgi:hypothetical protein